MNTSIRPTQKVVFINNKWGVGKTTLAYNTACKLADKGYKTLLVDADPQCNLTLLWLGAFQYQDLWLFSEGTIYHIVKNLMDWLGDIDETVQPISLGNNIDIVPWSIYLSDFDDTLTIGYNEVLNPNPTRWFRVISALQRYLHNLAMQKNYDVIIIDVSPSLTGSLNKNILMLSDFFITICNPDLFSEQGIMHLGNKLQKWKYEHTNIKNIALRGQIIPWAQILKSDPIFLGYIINKHKVYANQMITDERNWLEEIKPKIKEYLSEQHGKNGLVQVSYEDILATTQDYSRIAPIAQSAHKPLYKVQQEELWNPWSIELLEKCGSEIEDLTNTIIYRLTKWGV